MVKIKITFTNRATGDFKPHFQGPDFLLRLERQGNEHGLHRIFSPHCAFTTNVAKLGDGNQEYITNWFIRTTPGFDGGIVYEPRTGIAMFNADCPVIVLFDKAQNHLAMLHAGFRCLVPKDPKAPNIISSAFQKPLLDPKEVEAFIGLGAGSCCYGANHLDEIERREFRPFIAETIKGPRIGQLSLDISYLARELLMDAGVNEDAITFFGPKCTACEGRENDSRGKYYSNIYGDSGRNLVMAWFINR